MEKHCTVTAEHIFLEQSHAGAEERETGNVNSNLLNKL